MALISSAAVTTVNRVSANLVAPFTGLKSSAGFPVTKKTNNDITSITSNGGRVNCMQVIHPSPSPYFCTYHIKFNFMLCYVTYLCTLRLLKL